MSLVWFLVRVIPKPSRAAYPCQRAAVPLASGFVLWILGLAGSALAWRRGKEYSRRSRFLQARVCVCAAVLAALVAVVSLPEPPLHAGPTEPHGPLGVAKGIHPGRVVWVHAPDATDWAGYNSPEPWWRTNHTDLAVVEEMMSQVIRGVAGETSDRAAWEAIFQHFNEARGNGRRTYQAGEKIAIKINFAILKGHSSGITVCGKNHYGSLLRTPAGSLRGVAYPDYYDLHLSLPNAEWSPGMGHYRAVVDLMGHRELGGKTLLYLVDGLFAGYYWDSQPYPWTTAPFGDGTNGDWPSSLFASQDPVAIDSVAYDFLMNEWPDVVSGGANAPGSLDGGAEDYLHEAALAAAPPSGAFYDPEKDGVRLASLGVHEHWNNAHDKLYSRNLGLNEGIELVALNVSRQPPRLAVRRNDRDVVVSWPSSHAGYQLQSTDHLEPPPDWAPVTDAPVVQQAQNVVSNALGSSRRFYRLVK